MPEPIRLAVLGGRGAGKTCFLAGLVIAAEPQRATPLALDAVGPSRQRLDEWANHLRNGSYPPATNVTTPLDLTLTLDQALLALCLHDYPGEELLTTVRTHDAEQNPELVQHLHAADGLLLLFGPDTDLRPASAVQRDPALLQRFDSLLQEVVRSARGRAPVVAIVVTKADQEPELARPSAVRAFFRQHVPELDAKLRHHAARLGYFAVSAVGRAGVGAGRPPRVLAPTGYVELLRWIVAQRHAHRRAPLWRTVGAVAWPLLLLALGAGGYFYWQAETAQRAADAQRQAHLDEIARLQADVRTAQSVAQLHDLERAARAFAVRMPSDLRSELEATVRQVRAKLLPARFELVRQAHEQQQPNWTEQARRFLADFPLAQPEHTQINQWLQAERAARQAADRARLRALGVDSVDELRSFAAAVRGYVRTWHPTPDETSQKLLRVATLAEQFTEPREYELTLVRSGEFTAPHYHRVLVEANGGKWTFTADAAVRLHTWERTSFRITWDVRHPITVRWWYADTFGAAEVASRQTTGAASLARVCQRCELATHSAKSGYVVGTPFVEFRCPDLSAEDVALVAEYINPGQGW
jgi:hypothetical protein